MSLRLGSYHFPISPTSLNTWLSSQDQWLRKYVGKIYDKQTTPMAIGVAFDEIVKSHIIGATPDFASIEVANRQYCIDAGERCWQVYVKDGAWDRLKRFIDGSIELRIDMDKSIEVDIPDENGNIFPIWLRLKPDFVCRLPDGRVIVLDWKVNGYESQASPAAGYVYPKLHKDAILGEQVLTLNVDYGQNLWRKPDWARQLLMYSWGIEQHINDARLVGIEQIVFKNNEGHAYSHLASLSDIQGLATDLLRMVRWVPSPDEIRKWQAMDKFRDVLCLD